MFLVILGASVNTEAERQTVRDSTVGPSSHWAGGGAVVADSAPPYPGRSSRSPPRHARANRTPDIR